jgi:electron transport complex protein RnfG
MKESLRLVLVVTIFCLVAGLLLAWTNQVTRDPIAKARRAETIGALTRVLPATDNDVLQDARTVTEEGAAWTFYVGRNQGRFVGCAFEGSSLRGYGGLIRVLVGVLPDGNVNSVEILQADAETPGLGSKVREPGFLKQFVGRAAAEAGTWGRVAKDGGQIQAITGATITSRAVSEAVRAGLLVYARHAEEIAGAPAAAGAQEEPQ